MAKRFLDNQLFKNPTFKGLPLKVKLFYIYLICEVDHCGIWSVELDVAGVRIGQEITEADVKTYLNNKVISIDNGTKWFLPQFITFQYGNLTAGNKLHNAVRNELIKWDLLKYVENNQTVTEGLGNPNVTIKDKDKEKDKDKKKEKDKERGAENVVNILHNENGNYKPLDTDEDLGGGNSGQDGYRGFMAVYNTFIKGRGIPFRITGADGKALKDIIKYLGDVDTVKQGNKTPLEVWEFILSNWDNLDNWQQTQTQLRQINAQLPNIIEKLKQYYNGKSKSNYNQNTVANLANTLRNAIKNS